jgi:hypothetical protein
MINRIKWNENIKHIFASFFFSFGDWEGIQEKDKSLPKANAEYGDSKFLRLRLIIDFESKFPSRTIASYNLGIPYTSKTSFEAKFA